MLDTVGASALTIRAISTAVAPDAGDEAEQTMLALGVSIVGAAVFAFSAGYGYAHTAECDAAKQKLVQRLVLEAPPNPPAASPPGSSTQALPSPGCASDMECKGDRICVEHVCTAPVPAAPVPAAQTLPPTNEAPNPPQLDAGLPVQSQ